MNLPPKEYIAARRSELNLQKQAIDAELRILAQMESAILGQPVEHRNPLPSEGEPDGESASSSTPRQRYEKTIKQMVLEVLDAMPGLLSPELLEAVNKRFSIDIERTSFSPQMSRLKADGYIVAYNNRWRLSERGQQLLSSLRA
jgi:hypothetical protein